MADCPSLQTCPFFNDKLVGNPAMTRIYKERYCLGDNATCARFMVAKALGKEKVPADLFPNQIEIARNLIAKK